MPFYVLLGKGWLFLFFKGLTCSGIIVVFRCGYTGGCSSITQEMPMENRLPPNECAMVGGLPVSNRHLGFSLGTACRYEEFLLGAPLLIIIIQSNILSFYSPLTYALLIRNLDSLKLSFPLILQVCNSFLNCPKVPVPMKVR